MANWDDVKIKIEDGGKAVVDAVKVLADMANLRTQIIACDTSIAKGCKDLGKAYYEAHKEDEEFEFEVMAKLKESHEKKSALEAQLAELKAAHNVEDVDTSEDDIIQDAEVVEADTKSSDGDSEEV